MDLREKKGMAQKQIMNTLVKAAEIDETLDLRKMIEEICNTYDVEESSAQSWINELKDMKLIKTENSLGCHWIWHYNEKQIRQMFLEQGKAFDIEIVNNLNKETNTQ